MWIQCWALPHVFPPGKVVKQRIKSMPIPSWEPCMQIPEKLRALTNSIGIHSQPCQRIREQVSLSNNHLLAKAFAEWKHHSKRSWLTQKVTRWWVWLTVPCSSMSAQAQSPAALSSLAVTGTLIFRMVEWGLVLLSKPQPAALHRRTSVLSNL